MCAQVVPKFADEAQVFKDIDKTAEENQSVDDLVERSNEDASSNLETIFLNNVDFNNLEGWFIDLATRYTTATYWWKSNGTNEQKEKMEQVKEEAVKINHDRFYPVEFR